MTNGDDETSQVEALLATPGLADVLESEPFRHFLDHVPIAIIVSEMKGRERIVYVNPEFEKVSGQAATAILGRPWSSLPGQSADKASPLALGPAIVGAVDFVGTFTIERPGSNERPGLPPSLVAAYSNVVEDEDGTPSYRLAALVDVGAHGAAQGAAQGAALLQEQRQEQHQEQRQDLEQQLRDKEARLVEVRHRARNNLQMVAVLMRLEARNARGRMDTAPLDRLAGRVESIQLLYALLSKKGLVDEIDLGVYLSEIALAAMRAQPVEGVRLDLKIDAFPVSVNVAMPTGLVVNEILNNALKHAFVGRDGGTVTLHVLADGEDCRILVADDGIGLPPGAEWPRQGRLGALIVQSLRENAKARVEVESRPGEGVRITIVFTRAASAPEAPG